MAKGFDRRWLLGSGCALFAVGCSGDSDGSVFPTGHTGPTPTGDSGTTPASTYPCGQTDTPDGTFVELHLADWPDLETVGGWYGGLFHTGLNLVIAHVSEGCYAAVSRACTHEGVSVDYHPERLQFTCPRHGAVYAADGSKVSGPQPTGLQHFPCVRVGDSIFVKVT